ncbi:MAG TPA: ankyrin repeat domain-containing protein [Bryobacteraceae bacterium]|nr:ankyrin repeat domain-containing protein [Bryobacteraceae bacterium]
MAEKLPAATPHSRVEGPDLHQAIGGTAAWRRLAVAFYSRVDRDPVLRPLFPGKTFRCAIEEFTAFLAQVFEGPSEDTQFRWWLSLRESHLRFRIRQKERAAWMENMVKALDDAQIDEPLRHALREFFERSSAHVVNSGEPTPAAADPGEPPGDAIRREVARRWDAQCGLDEAVAAVRGGEADRAIAAAESLRNRFQRNRSVLAGLLALMMGSRNPAMLRYVEERVTHDPAFVRERYAGRTLLHAASAQGNRTMVELLLRLGADPNAPDGGSHTPLYCLANEYKAPDGGDVVRALRQRGANVNASGGAKRCTALHMAARRGNLEIAEALLDCGADIDARDSLGDSPLRRSVNCDQIQVTSLLLARGADVHSTGSKGLTPLRAARTSAMKQLLRSRSDSSSASSKS